MHIRKFLLLNSQESGGFQGDSCGTGGTEERLKQLVETDSYYQNMEEDAFDVVVQYANVTELVGVKNYRREDGRVDMCTAIREMMEDSRQEGEALLAALISHLFADNRAEDAKLAAEDEEARKRFYREYGMLD